MKRVVITGAKGLIGWHAHVRLHASNRAALFNGEDAPFDIVALDHTDFDDDASLQNALNGAQAVLHFAGVNRAPDDKIEAENPRIASRLVDACKIAKVAPHIVYANSTHAANDTPYGRSKRRAADVLNEAPGPFSNLILPHIFGEGARPFYNNVTATLIDNILKEETPNINAEGRVQLLHAGAAAQAAIDSMQDRIGKRIEPPSREIKVPELYKTLKGFHDSYLVNVYPNLADDFYRDLFNSYRVATYPYGWPRRLRLNIDARGTLFEAIKGGGGGQTFLSTTKPGVTRGNHFHLTKVERFLVIQGEAIIRVRKVLSQEVWEYNVCGDVPTPIDMPTLHTHSIENIGSSDLITLFWTNDLFDPDNPDTFSEKVLS